MKKVLAALFTIVFTSTACFAVQSPEEISDKNDTSGGKVENILSLEYGKLILQDSAHILSAPFRWNGREWLWAGIGVSAVAALAVFGDKAIDKEMAKHRLGFNGGFAETFQPFGTGYSYLVLGAFEAGGIIFKDDNARATAQDGLAASLIASFLVTTPIKYITGRSRPNSAKGSLKFDPFCSGDSFPSGHTTQAFAVASVIAEHYDSFWIKAAAYGLASAVGYARVEHRDHWASDVLAGALIGTLVGREVVRFNKNKRYQLSIYSDGESTGVKVMHRF